MKDNLYTQAIKNIKAPATLVDDTISRLSGASEESEVINMKETKHRVFKLTSAIAAVLALIITFGAITLLGGTNAEHSFILTANAAESTADEATPDEITKEAYVKIGEIKGFSDAGTGLHRKQYDENGDVYFDMYEAELLSLSEEFTLELTCTGENIESITYTAHNSCFAYDADYEGLLSVVELTEEEVKRYHASGGTDFYKWAASCTYDYNCQPKSLWDSAVMGFEIPEDGVDGTIPLRMAFNFEFGDGKYFVTIDEHTGDWGTDPIFEKEFNAHADEFALDVTANFADGTKTTKTLKFRCENINDHLYLYAIEA